MIERFTVNEACKYTLDSTGAAYTPNSMELVFDLNQPGMKGEVINVHFKYSGKITEWSEWSANVITTEWTEIGLYFPWFPVGSGSLPATYSLEIECPEEYRVFGMGEITRVKDFWIIDQKDPTNDIAIFLSEDMKIAMKRIENLELTFCYHSLSDTVLKAITGDLQLMYELFSRWFGQLNILDLCLVESKRELGGGYARTGEIVLGSFKNNDYFSNRIMYNQYIGHEVAHFWWNKAETSSWEDWINEAFAEYFSLWVIREVFGQDIFEDQLMERKKNIGSRKPIWGIERTDPDAYYVLYHKGAILLSQLELKIGLDNFLKIFRECYLKDINTTQEFLSLLRSQVGTSVCDWFENALKTY